MCTFVPQHKLLLSFSAKWDILSEKNDWPPLSTQNKTRMGEDVEPQFVPGSVVEFSGLKTTELNGKFGVVKRFAQDVGRYEIVLSGRLGTMAIKPENLTQANVIVPSNPDFKYAAHYQHIAFWPRIDGTDTIPVHAFKDWPTSDSQVEEEAFLKRRLGWDSPRIVGGVESRGTAKPDFMVYFDENDDVSPVNQAAWLTKKNLPAYEIQKLPRRCQSMKPRGVCVLIYSPLTSMLFSSNSPGEMVSSSLSGPENRRFPLHHLLDVLLFQESPEGRRQYELHDNPMHRVFGGI